MSIRLIVIIYLCLVGLTAGLLMASEFIGAFGQDEVRLLFADAFKTVLGAAIGALSVALSVVKETSSEK